MDHTRWCTLLAASQAAKELGRRELVRACHQTYSGGRQMIQEHAGEMEGRSAPCGKAMGLGTSDVWAVTTLRLEAQQQSFHHSCLHRFRAPCCRALPLLVSASPTNITKSHRL